MRGIGAALAAALGSRAAPAARADDEGAARNTEGEPAAPAEANAGPDAAMSALELQMVALVNGARLGRGLPALEWDATMAAVARAHAGEMMRRGVVSHTGADGSSPAQRLRRAGVQFQFGSENIWTYWGGIPERGPSTMHAAMMAEPFTPGVWNHAGNIVSTVYRRIGVGIATAPNGVQYLSETFAD